MTKIKSSRFELGKEDIEKLFSGFDKGKITSEDKSKLQFSYCWSSNKGFIQFFDQSFKNSVIMRLTCLDSHGNILFDLIQRLNENSKDQGILTQKLSDEAVSASQELLKSKKKVTFLSEAYESKADEILKEQKKRIKKELLKIIESM